MKAVSIAVLILVAAAAGAAAVLYTGRYDIAADAPDNSFVHWVLRTTMERSVAKRSAGVGAAPNLDDPALVRLGADHYREMCVQCHLAPGVASTEIRQGLNPRPPRLDHAVTHMSDQALFWVIKHGVRMTAMPAWGKTHSDRKIWAMVAFLKQLPGMTAAQYQTLAGSDEMSHDDHDHDHDHDHEDDVD